MINVETSVVINRPIEDVFAFVAKTENLALWAGPVTEAKQTSEGPVGVGTKAARVIQFLGRRIESSYEVTEYEPNSKYSTKTNSGPMPTAETLTFEAVEGGTKVTVSGEVEAAGLLSWPNRSSAAWRTDRRQRIPGP